MTDLQMLGNSFCEFGLVSTYQRLSDYCAGQSFIVLQEYRELQNSTLPVHQGLLCRSEPHCTLGVQGALEQYTTCPPGATVPVRASLYSRSTRSSRIVHYLSTKGYCAGQSLLVLQEYKELQNSTLPVHQGLLCRSEPHCTLGVQGALEQYTTCPPGSTVPVTASLYSRSTRSSRIVHYLSTRVYCAGQSLIVLQEYKELQNSTLPVHQGLLCRSQPPCTLGV